MISMILTKWCTLTAIKQTARVTEAIHAAPIITINLIVDELN